MSVSISLIKSCEGINQGDITIMIQIIIGAAIAYLVLAAIILVTGAVTVLRKSRKHGGGQ